MYRTPTARLLAKTISSTKNVTTTANPVNRTPRHGQRTTAKEQLRAQLLENQQRFLSYMASIVEERDALRQENGTLREQRQQAVDEKNRLSRIIAGAKQYLGGGEEVLEEGKALRSSPTTFKPKKNECISDFIVGDEVNGFRCGLCLKQHGDAKVYWKRISIYMHLRSTHKVQAKMNLPLPKVDYDPTKHTAKQFYEKIGPDEWKCKVCAGVGRDAVVRKSSTARHLKSIHVRTEKQA